jgi:hypothetical protein
MPLSALLLAVISGAASTNDRRARLHELWNRLGIAPPAPVSDLATRLRHAFATYLDDGPDDPTMAMVLVDQLSIESTNPTLRHDPEPLFPGSRYGIRFPVPGAHHPDERHVDWLVREMKRRRAGGDAFSSVLTAWSGIRDWVLAENVDLRSVHYGEAWDRAARWHATLRTGLGYRRPIPDTALIVARFPDGGTIQRLMTKKDFAAEGTSMGHCVGGSIDRATGLAPGDSHFWQETRDGTGAIYSVRDPSGTPQATIEVELRMAYPARDHPPTFFQVAQTQGPNNGPVEDDLARAFAWTLIHLAPVGFIHEAMIPIDPPWLPRVLITLGDRGWRIDKGVSLEPVLVFSRAFAQLHTGPDPASLKALHQSVDLTHGEVVRVLNHMDRVFPKNIGFDVPLVDPDFPHPFEARNHHGTLVPGPLTDDWPAPAPWHRGWIKAAWWPLEQDGVRHPIGWIGARVHPDRVTWAWHPGEAGPPSSTADPDDYPSHLRDDHLWPLLLEVDLLIQPNDWKRRQLEIAGEPEWFPDHLTRVEATPERVRRLLGSTRRTLVQELKLPVNV